MVKYIETLSGTSLFYIDYTRKYHNTPGAFICTVIGENKYYETIWFANDNNGNHECFDLKIINKLNKLVINTIFSKQVDRINN